MRWQHRLVRLERLLPAPPPPRADERRRQKLWHRVVQRLMGLLDQALPLMAAAEQAKVLAVLDQLPDSGSPLIAWLDDLYDGRCRLPVLTPETMKALLLAWLSPQVDGGMVCRHCGLEYPQHKAPPMSEWRLLPGKKPLEGPPPWYDLPEFFPCCPCCGGSCLEIDWPHLLAHEQRSWMTLDGFVGQGQIRGRP
jgi:hypothetical protein